MLFWPRTAPSTYIENCVFGAIALYPLILSRFWIMKTSNQPIQAVKLHPVERISGSSKPELSLSADRASLQMVIFWDATTAGLQTRLPIGQEIPIDWTPALDEMARGVKYTGNSCDQTRNTSVGTEFPSITIDTEKLGQLIQSNVMSAVEASGCKNMRGLVEKII